MAAAAKSLGRARHAAALQLRFRFGVSAHGAASVVLIGTALELVLPLVVLHEGPGTTVAVDEDVPWSGGAANAVGDPPAERRLEVATAKRRDLASLALA